MIKFKMHKVVLNKKLIPIVCFLAISIGMFFFMGYNKIANRGPFSQHSYRQGDSYAFALNYYYEHNKFSEPSVLCVIEDLGGKTVSEFPGIYYLTAQIWKITGVNPFVLRLLDLIILFLGLFSLYKLSFEILKDHFWASLVSLLMFSSPLLGYYGFNFLPNIPALGFALIATYYYYKYHTSSEVQFLILSTILFSLGGVIKISSLFAFLAIYAVFFLQNILRIKQNRKAILLQLGSIVFVFAIVFSWYSFSSYYNSRNLSGLFQNGIIPIWKLSSVQIEAIMSKVYTNTIIYFFNPFALMALGVLFIISAVLWKKTNKTLLSITCILLLGVTMFILLFFEGMDYHEYFLIDATVIIPAITITFLTTLKGFSINLFNSKIVKIFSFVLLLLALNYNMVMTRTHYNPYDKMVTQNIPLPTRVQNDWKWVYCEWEIHIKKYDGIIPYIRSLGIKFEDKVISIPDESPNRTLTLLNQKGFTDFHYSLNYKGSKITERKIELGAKYMIVEGEENLLREDVAPFTKNQIGEFNGIKIFRLADKE